MEKTTTTKKQMPFSSNRKQLRKLYGNAISQKEFFIRINAIIKENYQTNTYILNPKIIIQFIEEVGFYPEGYTKNNNWDKEPSI
jgi:hypothetical protein